MSEAILLDTEEHMKKALSAMERDFKRVRSGRASPDMVEHIHVDYYGSMTALPQVANISAPEPRLLVIKAFDNSILGAIEKAIIKSDLGITPSNDGKVIRLNVPALTEETRKKMVNETKKSLEHAKIGTRNARRDGNKHIDNLFKDKAISEDQREVLKEKIQDLTNKYELKLEQSQKTKEKELLTV